MESTITQTAVDTYLCSRMYLYTFVFCSSQEDINIVNIINDIFQHNIIFAAIDR